MWVPFWSISLRRFLVTIGFLALAGLLLGGCGTRYEFNGTELTDKTVAYDIAGVDTRNHPFRLSDLQGRHVLVNFGYTWCPDVCPLTLANLTSFYTRLLEQEDFGPDDVAVVFVTVDPERDQIERLRLYVDAFHTDFYGVYIDSQVEMEAVLTAYNIGVQRRYLPGADDTVTYEVDHAAGIYVIDPNGIERLYLPHDIDPDKILADVSHLISRSQ